MRTATFYNFLIEANIMASIAIILMLVVRRFFRKQLGNRAIYFAWALVAIRLLCPLALPNPAINEIRPEIQGDQGMRPIADQVRVRLHDAASDLYYRSFRAEQSETVTDAAQTVSDALYKGTAGMTALKIYLIGVGVTSAWFVLSNVRFRRKLKAGRIEPITGKLLEQYNALCASRGVKPIPVYFTDPLPSACLVGVFKPYIALPLTAKPQDAINVLLHEVCHYRGKDHWLGVVRLLCCAVHWFNPLVWLASDMSRTDGELACDDRVVDKLDKEDKIAYANVLVLAAAKRCAPGLGVLATGMTMTGKKLRTRVSAILHREHFKRGFALAFMIVSSMLLVCAFATDEVKPSIHIPTLAPVDTDVRFSLISEEEAIARAEVFFALETVNLAEEITEIHVESHENGVWRLMANADGFDAPVADLRLSEQGQVLYYDYFLSGLSDSYNTPLGRLTGDNMDIVRRAEDYALHFALSVMPAERFGNPSDVQCISGSKAMDNAFMMLETRTNGDVEYLEIILQVSPVTRVVSYQNRTALNRITAPFADDEVNASTDHELVGFDETVGGFRAKNKSAEYISYTSPSDGDITLEKALDIAVKALCKEYGEIEENFIEIHALEYGFVNHEYSYYPSPHWEFQFIFPRSGEPLFSVYVHSPDGEILYMQNGNG